MDEERVERNIFSEKKSKKKKREEEVKKKKKKKNVFSFLTVSLSLDLNYKIVY